MNMAYILAKFEIHLPIFHNYVLLPIL
ncbi:unnamed protein product [Debaryomyces tyrocola]|nr:unnamed protein product [Debaryomyces tyrocola]